MIRTDIHRPSVILPEDYDYVGQECARGDDLGSCYFIMEERAKIRSHMECTGGTYSSHAHGGNCHICGNVNAIYTHLFHHKPSNTYIRCGDDCAYKLDSSIDGSAFRSKCENALEASAGKRKAKAVLDQAGHGKAWEIYVAGAKDAAYEEFTIVDIVGKLVKYGSVSDKQLGFIGKLLGNIDTRAERLAARAIEDAKSQFQGEVGARIQFTAKVVFVTSFDSAYGTVNITKLVDANGNVFVQKGKYLDEKGRTLTIKATVKQHNVREGVNQTIITRPVVIASIQE